MNDKDVKRLLEFAADMQDFAPMQDELTDIVREYTYEKELSEDELKMVSAASGAPKKDFLSFTELIKNHGENNG